ncbi:MAG: amino acid--tRNA ligase-related protein [Candidatus Uhrbacteria bacterium]|nr:amino acid--tRNA ligase-related protein [Candidatus Uhrbacteria bacterium]
MQNTLRIEAATFKAARSFFEDQGFIETFPPRIVRASGACENIDTLFEVRVDGDHKWFEPKGKSSNAYLAQTGQLYLEAFVPLVQRVFCVGPSFRAESAIDNRHMTEFTMLEIEFAGGFNDLLEQIEGMVSHVAHVIANTRDHLEINETERTRLSSCPSKFARLTYDQAIQELKDAGEIIKWGDDINSTREQMLVEKLGNQPIFITHFPDPMMYPDIEVEKFFNMLPDPERKGRVQSADLILPVAGESVGAAARVHEADELIDRLTKSKMFARLKNRGGSLDDFSWYIEQNKKNGAVPHAGCGFGMARILKWIHGTDDIRTAVTFPQNKAILI